MNIGILTHHFGINYGGILQCYALCTFLRRMGHNPVVIVREPDWNWKTPLRICLDKLGLLRFVERTDRVDGSKLRPFVQHNFVCTTPIRARAKMLQVCADYDLQAVVVGSDQVWRREFIEKWGLEYFLDFVPSGVRKLAYAASIGVNRWDYGADDSKRIVQLLATYKAVSVREDEAATLIADALNFKAEVMPDPTLLLTADDYRSLFDNRRLVAEPYTFVYWLNPDESSLRPILAQHEAEGRKVVRIGLHQQEALPGIEDWLAFMAHAESVVTDSFHGIVFALIFGRPLHICCNKAGGFGRISSLLNLLGCPELLDSPNATIDTQRVCSNINALRDKALDFLQRGLCCRSGAHFK